MKLIIARGVSGSGKSSWANDMMINAGFQIVSRDIIRQRLFGFESMQDEEWVSATEITDLRYHLSKGRDVISDNTNIKTRYVQNIANIGYEYGAEVSIKSFDVPLVECLFRNKLRGDKGGRFVPEEVIRKQYQNFEQTKNYTLLTPFKPEPYVPNNTKPSAIIVDIDGTLAKMNGRSPYDWHRVGEDSVNNPVASIVGWACDYKQKIIVMSGRDAICRPETMKWLENNCLTPDLLLMRQEKDQRKDNIVKAELFDQYVRHNYNVKFVLDDRNQVVDMWRAMGLTCLQVAPGNF